jgi:ABC-type polysaccharide/polyol phosphate transport system ATPase subunit
LKLAAGLLKLDAGSIQHRGRMQALINLGTGFNPNLTGRDNVFNAAAIRGFGKDEIRSRVEEIVAFAELEEVIDSPFGTYSSGMKARLGFSTAVHLQPDILLVDEVLSVGDQAFRTKSFARMKALREDGAAIVLVSHNHGAVTEMCDRALWLENGQPKMVGDSKSVVEAYLAAESNEERANELERLEKATKQKMKRRRTQESLYGPVYDDLEDVDGIEVTLSSGGAPVRQVPVGAPLSIDYRFRLKRRVEDLNVTLALYQHSGRAVTAISTLNGDLLLDRHEGDVHCRLDIRALSVAPGQYVWVMPIHEGKSYLYRGIVGELEVVGVTTEPGVLDLQATTSAHAEVLGAAGSGGELEPKFGLDDGFVSCNSVYVRGWVLNSQPVTRVRVVLDGEPLGEARCGLLRPDLARRFPEYGIDRGGFEFSMSRVTAEDGERLLVVEAYADDELLGEIDHSVNCTADTGLPTKIGISEASAVGRELFVRGWVVSSAPVTRIDVQADSERAGNAAYGLLRADVHKQYPEYNNPHAGFELTLSGASLAPPRTKVWVRAYSEDCLLAESCTGIKVGR